MMKSILVGRMPAFAWVLTISAMLLFFTLMVFIAPAYAEAVSGVSKTVSLSAGGDRNVTALQIDLSDPSIRIFSVHANNRVGATLPLKDIANQLAGDKYEVICAINGTFFDAYVTGRQVGLGAVISNGEMIYKLDGTFIGFGANNEVKMDWIHIECIGCVDNIMDKSTSFYIHNWNKVLPSASSYRETLLTPAFGETTGDTDMNVLVVRNGVIQSIGKGNTAIPSDGYVYLYPDNSPYNDGRFQAGKEIRYETTYYDKERNVVDWSNITNITGVGPSLMKNGVKTANAASEGWTDVKLTANAGQRSFIGFDSTGKTLTMGTVGNCTISQLGDVAQAYGLYNAMNLDGGASSGLLYQDKYLTTPGRNLSNAIVVVRLKGAATPAPQPAPAPAVLSATPTNASVLVDGKAISFDAYNIGGNNYFKLRDIAMAINGSEKQFEITWNAGNNAIELLLGQAYTAVGGELVNAGGASVRQAAPGGSVIYLDGRIIDLAAYNIGGNNYFKLRDLGKVLNFGVDWDDAANTIKIDTAIDYAE